MAKITAKDIQGGTRKLRRKPIKNSREDGKDQTISRKLPKKASKDE